MISQLLKSDIEAFAADRRRCDPLLSQARTGQVSPRVVAAYLKSIHYLLSHTSECLSRARERARSLDCDALARFYDRKLAEERGHEAWAEADIAELERRLHVLEQGTVPAMEALVSYLLDVVDRQPARYLAYVLFAEYFTVLLGPEWITTLERSCGIPVTAMTAVAQHAELDRQHVEEGFREVDALIEETDIPGVRETLRQAMDHFALFTSQLSALPN